MRNVPDKNAGDSLSSQEWDEGVMEELKNCITDTSQSFSNSDLTQLVQAMVLISNNRSVYVEAAGSDGSAYVVDTLQTLGQKIKFIQSGLKISLIVTNSNTTTNPTIAFDGIVGTFNIVGKDGGTLSIGFLQPNDVVDMYYDGTNFIVSNFILNEKDVNQSNYYTATFATNNFTLDNLLVNPTTYYDGLLVNFISDANTTTTTTITITGLGSAPLVNHGDTLTFGFIRTGQMVTAVYYSGSFYIISVGKNLEVNTNNTYSVTNTDDINYRSAFNVNGVVDINAATTLTAAQSHQIFRVINTSVFQITLPALSSTDFNCEYHLNTTSNSNITIAANGSETIYYNGAAANSKTINIDNGMFTIKRLNGTTWFMYGVGQATETVKGVTSLATQAEVDAGTNDTNIITPLKLANSSAQGESLNAANGWYKTGTGLIIQWGITGNVTSSKTITFPIPFPSACYSVTLTNNSYTNTAGDKKDHERVSNVTKTSFVAMENYELASSVNFYWQAIGA